MRCRVTLFARLRLPRSRKAVRPHPPAPWSSPAQPSLFYFLRDVLRPEDFRPEDFFPPVFRPVLLRGTFAPFSRASDNPIAIACLRLVTFLPLPLSSVPFFLRRIADSTRLPAAFPYFLPPVFFLPPAFFAAMPNLPVETCMVRAA